MKRFRHYVNLGRTLPKLEQLVAEHPFVGISEAMAAIADRELETIDVETLLSAG